jgi:hypothetical protein
VFVNFFIIASNKVNFCIFSHLCCDILTLKNLKHKQKGKKIQIVGPHGFFWEARVLIGGKLNVSRKNCCLIGGTRSIISQNCPQATTAK